MSKSKLKSQAQNEADAILNRVNVAQARSQRLVASWFADRDDADGDDVKSRHGKTDEELDREEAEMFRPMPEL